MNDVIRDKPLLESVVTVEYHIPAWTIYEHYFQRQMGIKCAAIEKSSFLIEKHNTLCSATLSRPIHLLIVRHFHKRY